MGFYNFPHTRNYDSDLGFLIKKYKTLDDKYTTLIDIYNVVQKDIKDITLVQLEKWLNDGTLEKLINENIFTDLNNQINTLNNDVTTINSTLPNKTNIEETNQNRIQGICRTYGMYEKGANAWFATNDFTVRPGVSGFFPPNAKYNNYSSRDSVALLTFGLGAPPLINQSVSSFTSTSITLPNLDDSVIVDPRHNLAIKDLDFMDTVADIYQNNTRVYYGYIKSYNPSTKTFTLRDNTGFYKVGSSDLNTYTPPSNSQVMIGNITAVWGAHIAAQDEADGGANNVVNTCGMELMVIHNKNTKGCRNLHLTTLGNYDNNYYILADGSINTQVGAYLTKLTQRGIMCKLDSSMDNNAANFWILGLQSSTGDDLFHINGVGCQNVFAVNISGTGSGFNREATIHVLTDSTPATLDLTPINTPGRVAFLCNHGSSVTHTVTGGLGGANFTIPPQKSLMICKSGSVWYPVMKGDLK